MLCVSRIFTSHPVNWKQGPHSFAKETREPHLVQNNSANETERDTVKTDSSFMSEGTKTSKLIFRVSFYVSKEGRVTTRRCGLGGSLLYCKLNHAFVFPTLHALSHNAADFNHRCKLLRHHNRLWLDTVLPYYAFAPKHFKLNWFFPFSYQDDTWIETV